MMSSRWTASVRKGKQRKHHWQHWPTRWPTRAQKGRKAHVGGAHCVTQHTHFLSLCPSASSSPPAARTSAKGRESLCVDRFLGILRGIQRETAYVLLASATSVWATRQRNRRETQWLMWWRHRPLLAAWDRRSFCSSSRACLLCWCRSRCFYSAWWPLKASLSYLCPFPIP